MINKILQPGSREFFMLLAVACGVYGLVGIIRKRIWIKGSELVVGKAAVVWGGMFLSIGVMAFIVLARLK